MLVLPEGVVIPKASDELDPDDPDEAKLIELWEKNKKAYSSLVCSMDTSTPAGNVAFSWFGQVRVSIIRMGIHQHPGIS
jgi:hypothetical protein